MPFRETGERLPGALEQSSTEKSPDLAEISGEMGLEEVRGYAKTATAYVEHQTASLGEEAKDRIGVAAEKLGFSPGALEAALAESSVADELAALTKEGSDLTDGMRAEITEVLRDEAERTSADWLKEQKKLKEEPYLAPDRKTFSDIQGAFFEIERQNHLDRVDERSSDTPVRSIDTRLIVRAPSLKDWSDSYHTAHDEFTSARGENAVIEICRKISSTVKSIGAESGISTDEQLLKTDRALEEAGIYSEAFPIRLKGYEGPRGPIYVAEDGSHRVAAAKLTGLDHVRGKVGDAKDKEKARKVWYESLALMPITAREELRATYDQVYPPTPEEKQADEEALEEAETYLSEIYAERNLNRDAMQTRAQAESERFREAERRFSDAQAFADQLTDTKRFNRLKKEAGLAYLKDHAPADLWDEYEQRIDDDGYLVRKDGGESYITSTGYDVGDSYRQIIISAVEKYRQEFPES